jgi:two-component SAPR family response regulator
MTSQGVTGCRILVVEDETLIVLMIEGALAEMGCDIVGPAAKLEAALNLANDGEFDAAILDVTIRGGKVYPVAEQLIARGIPFVFASGYGNWALPEALRDRPRLTKPFTFGALKEQIKSLCDQVEARKRAQPN